MPRVICTPETFFASNDHCNDHSGTLMPASRKEEPIPIGDVCFGESPLISLSGRGGPITNDIVPPVLSCVCCLKCEVGGNHVFHRYPHRFVHCDLVATSFDRCRFRQ